MNFCSIPLGSSIIYLSSVSMLYRQPFFSPFLVPSVMTVTVVLFTGFGTIEDLRHPPQGILYYIGPGDRRNSVRLDPGSIIICSKAWPWLKILSWFWFLELATVWKSSCQTNAFHTRLLSFMYLVSFSYRTALWLQRAVKNHWTLLRNGKVTVIQSLRKATAKLWYGGWKFKGRDLLATQSCSRKIQGLGTCLLSQGGLRFMFSFCLTCFFLSH